MLKEFQIGIEGDKGELLDFIADFDFNKITLNVTDGRAMFVLFAPLDENTQYVLEQIQQSNVN